MKINLTSVHVDDQDETLKFYTEVLGFVKKQNLPVGRFKWLTVVSPEEPEGPELLLEPSDNPAARAYKVALYGQGIPAASFAVDDIHSEHERLAALGVEFRIEPTDVGPAVISQLTDGHRHKVKAAWRRHGARV
jgi:catechol 2,3-dioxygenase-like lactoylglutathione lyase family enzyme